jgi:hypothetical protein
VISQAGESQLRAPSQPISAAHRIGNSVILEATPALIKPEEKSMFHIKCAIEKLLLAPHRHISCLVTRISWCAAILALACLPPPSRRIGD